MRTVKINKKKILDKINQLLIEVDREEVVSESDDVPMMLNVLKLLEVYCDENKHNFYGTVSIKIVGVKCRNLKIIERSFKLCEEKLEYLEP